MLSINEMIKAINCAYRCAKNKFFTTEVNNYIINIIEETCWLDEDEKLTTEIYLALSPSKLEKLFNDIKKIVVELLNAGYAEDSEIIKDTLVYLFGIKVKETFK